MSRLLPALALAFSLAACTSTGRSQASEAEAAGTAEGSIAPGKVDGAAARRLVKEGARLVDVRTPGEYAAGHVEGAVNLPLDQVAQRASELGPKETPLVVYCRSGHRSGMAARTLRSLGYERVYDLGPMSAW